MYFWHISNVHSKDQAAINVFIQIYLFDLKTLANKTRGISGHRFETLFEINVYQTQ